MTHIYFVRHCQSQAGWKQSDSIRPLTPLGMADSELVTIALHTVKLDYCICSDYIRSQDTIRSCAKDHGLEIHTDARLGERISGKNNDDRALINRWADRNYCEEGGECLNSTQKRNMECLHKLLQTHENETILFGTHGTALSTILNFYEPEFGYDNFLELLNWMPYIIHAEFDGSRLIKRENVLILNRGY